MRPARWIAGNWFSVLVNAAIVLGVVYGLWFIGNLAGRGYGEIMAELRWYEKAVSAGRIEAGPARYYDAAATPAERISRWKERNRRIACRDEWSTR